MSGENHTSSLDHGVPLIGFIILVGDIGLANGLQHFPGALAVGIRVPPTVLSPQGLPLILLSWLSAIILAYTQGLCEIRRYPQGFLWQLFKYRKRYWAGVIPRCFLKAA
mgnify:CR=1 FL=1